MMRKVLPVISFVCLPFFLFSQLAVSAVKTTFTIDFANTVAGVNNGSFVAPGTVATASPVVGALDSDGFQISSTQGTGFNWPAMPGDVSEGQNSSSGNAGAPGIYNYINGANNFLGVKPDTDNFTPGAIILRVQNTSGAVITQFEIGYSPQAFNNSDNSTNITFYYSSDGSTWTAESDLNYASSTTQTGGWESADRSTCIPALNIANNGFFYLKWVIDGSSSSLDPVGIDDIEILGRTPVVGFTTSSSVVAELDPDMDGSTQSYYLEITMDAPPAGGNMALTITTMNNTATGGSDFSAINGLNLITFSQSSCYPQTKDLLLSLGKDTSPEPNEDFDVTFTIAGPGTSATNITAHTVTIANDDVPYSPITLFSLGSGNWSDPGRWGTAPGGSATIDDPNNLLGDSGPEYNIIVQKGDTVTLDGDKGIHTLTVDGIVSNPSLAGRLQVGDQNTVHYLQIYGESVEVVGVLGNEDTRDGISLEIHSDSTGISGSGNIDLYRIRKDGNQDSKLTINTDVNLRGTGAVLYNNADGFSFDPTIESGNTLTAKSGNVSIDGEDGTSSRNSKGTVTVDGILDIEDGNLYLKTNNPSSPADDITYSISGSGIIKVRGFVFGNNGSGGNASGVLAIASGGELQLSGPGDFFTDYSNSRNDFNPNDGSIINFSGNLAQMLPPLPFFGSLTLSGGGDKTLQANTTILGELDLQSGDLVLDDYDATINITGSIEGGSSTSYVKTNGTGSLIQTVGNFESLIFPVGNSTYNPATLVDIGGVTDQFSVRVEDQVFSQGSSGSQIISSVVDRTWFIDEAVDGGSVINLILQWTAANALGGFDPENCYIGHFTGSEWEESNIPTASITDDNTTFVLSASGIDEFSPFIVAAEGAVLLPVELTHFKAFAKNNTTILEWSTHTELNNDYFVIERSGDLRSFEAIGQVAGQGTSLEQHHYAFVDKHPIQGANYYRLKQVDFDGSFSYSDIVSLQFDKNSLEVWPNPVTDHLQLFSGEFSELPVEVEIYNISGQKLITRSFSGVPDRLYIGDLPSGHYFLRLQGDHIPVQQARFIKM